jgi:NodT family efflux transporter outer membrane factor (OMF) lipoprotein
MIITSAQSFFQGSMMNPGYCIQESAPFGCSYVFKWVFLAVITLSVAGCAGGFSSLDSDNYPELISENTSPKTLWHPTTSDQQGTVSSKTSASPADVHTQWHQIIRSEQLDALINEALANNPDLQATAANVLASRKQAEIRTGERLPEIDLTLDGGRSRNAIGDTSDSFNGGLNLSWELDIWNRLADAEQAALLTAEQQRLLYQAARKSLAAQIASGWIEAIEAKRQYQLAKEQEQSLYDSLQVIEDGFRSGIREALDVYSARAEWINGQSASFQRKQTLNIALRDLSVLLGRYPSVKDDIPDQLPNQLAALPTGLSSELLEQRPDIMAAYAAVQSQQFNLQVAGSNRLPRLTLTASAGATSDELSDVLRGDEFIWNALGGLTIPVFNAGTLQAEQERQYLLLKSAIADYRQTALTAFSEVETAIDNEQLITLRLDASRESVVVSEQAEDQAFERYIAGLENLNTWLQAQRTAFERTSSMMALEANLFTNRIALHQAIGGDFSVSQDSGDPLIESTSSEHSGYSHD